MSCLLNSRDVWGQNSSIPGRSTMLEDSNFGARTVGLQSTLQSRNRRLLTARLPFSDSRGFGRAKSTLFCCILGKCPWSSWPRFFQGAFRSVEKSLDWRRSQTWWRWLKRFCKKKGYTASLDQSTYFNKPGVTKGCFLEAFKYLKTSKGIPLKPLEKHVFLFFQLLGRSCAGVVEGSYAGEAQLKQILKGQGRNSKIKSSVWVLFEASDRFEGDVESEDSFGMGNFSWTSLFDSVDLRYSSIGSWFWNHC